MIFLAETLKTNEEKNVVGQSQSRCQKTTPVEMWCQDSGEVGRRALNS